MKKYLIPALVAVAILGGLFLSGRIPGTKKESAKPAESEVVKIAIPHGRVLCVVVDDDGLYVGREFIPFILFRKFLSERGRSYKADYAFICGTESARFGRAVEALDAIRAVLKINATMETRSMPNGTRRQAVEILGDFRNDESDETCEPGANRHRCPTSGGGTGDRASGAPGSP